MAEHSHRDWSIQTQATDQGFIFRCQKQATPTKAYGWRGGSHFGGDGLD